MPNFEPFQVAKKYQTWNCQTQKRSDCIKKPEFSRVKTHFPRKSRLLLDTLVVRNKSKTPWTSWLRYWKHVWSCLPFSRVKCKVQLINTTTCWSPLICQGSQCMELMIKKKIERYMTRKLGQTSQSMNKLRNEMILGWTQLSDKGCQLCLFFNLKISFKIIFYN